MVALLEGIRVLDFTQVLSGPTVTRYLAELGAEIIKVEPLRGDTTRATATVKMGRSGFFLNANRGKRSLCVDLKHPDGKALVMSLVPKVDIVVENFSPGTIDRLGFGWDVLHEMHPGVVMCSISGFGQVGPMAKRPGYDGIAAGYAGITALNGEPDLPPAVSGAAVGDVLTGVNGAAGILGALFHRERTGEGQRVEVSILDSFMQAHDSALQTFTMSDGEIVQTRSGQFHPIASSYGVFRASDGFLFLNAAPDRHWVDLCAAMGRPELAAEDHPWHDRRVREAEAEQCNRLVEDWLLTMKRDDALALLETHRVPIGPVLAMDEVVAHEGMREMGTIVTTTDPVVGEMDVAGSPIKFSGTERFTDLEAPFLGEHNREIIVDVADEDPARYEQLLADGVIAEEPIRNRPSKQRPLS